MSGLKLFHTTRSGVTEVMPRPAEVEADVQGLVEAYMETLLGVRLLATEYGTGPVHVGRIDRGQGYAHSFRKLGPAHRLERFPMSRTWFDIRLFSCVPTAGDSTRLVSRPAVRGTQTDNKEGSR